MTEKKPCSACRALIDAPSTVAPHQRLDTYGPSKVFGDFTRVGYECSQCHTRFRRHETFIPDWKVFWMVIE
jgi:hypothetical protein